MAQAKPRKICGKICCIKRNEFICEGKTLREAKQIALEREFENPFVTFVYSENEIPFGGW